MSLYHEISSVEQTSSLFVVETQRNPNLFKIFYTYVPVYRKRINSPMLFFVRNIVHHQ